MKLNKPGRPILGRLHGSRLWILSIFCFFGSSTVLSQPNVTCGVNVVVTYLVGPLSPSRPQRILSGLRETFIKRYIVGRINKVQIRPEEQSEHAECCRENSWNEIQLKGPWRQKQTQELKEKERASSVGSCQKRKPQHPHHVKVRPRGLIKAQNSFSLQQLCWRARREMSSEISHVTRIACAGRNVVSNFTHDRNCVCGKNCRQLLTTRRRRAEGQRAHSAFSR